MAPELANRKVLKRIDAPLDETASAHRPITLRDLLTLTCLACLLRWHPITACVQGRRACGAWEKIALSAGHMRLR